MAAKDVISVIDSQVANGADLTIQPASGDEWLVTGFLVEGTTIVLRMSADTGSTGLGSFGGSTGGTADVSQWGIRRVNHLLTNADYEVLNNGSGGTIQLGFSGIKTKE